MDIKVNRSKSLTAKEYQNYLERSEKKDSDTINLDGRNSLKKNKYLRNRERVAATFVKMFIFAATVAVITTLGIKAILPETVTGMEVQAQEVILEDKMYYSNAEMEDFIEQVEEVYVKKDEEIVTYQENVSTECDILCRATDFVIQYEGYTEKPYWDAVRYSIGHGTPANGRTYISREQARQEVEDRLFATIRELQYHIDDEGMIVALASFKYNVGQYPAGWKWYIENGYTNGLKNRMKEYTYSGDKYLQGLMNRRIAETNLF